MTTPILATKLHIPAARARIVTRARLIEQLNEGLEHRLTLISAPAGFGKTTLVSEWLAGLEQPAAWLSLDEGDNDPARFLSYFVAALQTINEDIAQGILGVLQSPQAPPVEPILTTLLNEIAAIPHPFILVLEDYHVVDTKPVDDVIAFLLGHMPPQMHLVITTREDPQLPLARYRARGQLTELRAVDLRFTPEEAADFLNQVMGLHLSPEEIAALETRTEGWIAGLQLAAISMQGHTETTSFIKSFTGSHHFVMDYLVEEVLRQQAENIQTFLLRTSILDRLCGPLCDAVVRDPSAAGQQTLEYLERSNLFIVPLDDERLWFRYHHLFADLLRQRLLESTTSSTEAARSSLAELHIRASQWYEDNGMPLQAFHHAVAAEDIERAARLVEEKGMPLQSREAVISVLAWLQSLPNAALNAKPWLWWRYASLLLINGQSTGVEEKLQAAEAALEDAEESGKTRNLIGQIAGARAVLALSQYQVEPMLVQSRRALEYLDPSNLSSRASANWTLGFAYFNLGDRTASRRALTEAAALSQAAGDVFTTILATIGLGQAAEKENQLYDASETFQRVVQLAGNQPHQVIGEAHLGLARVLYEWNDLDAAERHGQEALRLERQYERVIDRFIICEVFLARLRLTRGDLPGAAAMLAEADRAARQNSFVLRMPEIAAARVLTMIRQGDLESAAILAQTYQLPLSQARVHLAQGKIAAALALLGQFRQQMEEKGWEDERLRAIVLQAIALHAHGEKDNAMQVLAEAFAMAEPGGFIRLFVDEGLPMARLLSEAAVRGLRPAYIRTLLAAFEAEAGQREVQLRTPSAQPLIEPLSQRELEVLRLIAQGLSNREIGDRLFLALSTVKGHSRIIFDKLQVQRRTEAVARARELGLL